MRSRGSAKATYGSPAIHSARGEAKGLAIEGTSSMSFRRGPMLRKAPAYVPSRTIWPYLPVVSDPSSDHIITP